MLVVLGNTGSTLVFEDVYFIVVTKKKEEFCCIAQNE